MTIRITNKVIDFTPTHDRIDIGDTTWSYRYIVLRYHMHSDREGNAMHTFNDFLRAKVPYNSYNCDQLMFPDYQRILVLFKIKNPSHYEVPDFVSLDDFFIK